MSMVQRPRYYEVGDVVETGQPWQAKIAQSLVEAGYAAEAKVVASKETKTKTKSKEIGDLWRALPLSRMLLTSR